MSLLGRLKRKSIPSIARNFIFMAMGEGLGGLTLVAVMIYIARTLGPSEFGKIGLAESVFMFFMVFVRFGLDLIGIREIARDKERIRHYTERILSLKLVFAVLSFAVLLVFAFFIKKSVETKYVIVLYGVALFPMALLVDWVYQGIERMQYRAYALIIREALFAACVLFFLRSYSSVIFVAAMFLLSRVVSTIFLLATYTKHLGRPRLRLGLEESKKLTKSAFPIGLGYLFAWFLLYFDLFIISFLSGDLSLGLYNAAYKPVFYGMVICGSYDMAIFPSICKAAGKEDGSLERLLFWSTKLIFLFWLPLAVLATFLAAPIIAFIYGHEFVGAATALRILPWALVILSINNVLAKGLIGTNNEYRLSQILFVRTLIIIILSVVLIPLIGFVGAAIAKVASEALVSPLYFISLRRRVKINIAGLLKPLIYGLFMALFIAFSFGANSLFLVGGALTVYGFAMFVFEWKNIKNIFQSMVSA